LAACKAYLRIVPTAAKDIHDFGNVGTPILVMVAVATRYADDLEGGTVTATDPALTEALKGTVAGLRSAVATANAWTTGTLDLSPDLTVVYEESTKVMTTCKIADPAGDYVAMVNQ
jgi:hypothetical protein